MFELFHELCRRSFVRSVRAFSRNKYTKQLARVLLVRGLMSDSPVPTRNRLSSLSTYVGTSSSRLQSLYSDISRQKLSNPTSYQSNVAWWRTTLETIVSRGWQSDTTERVVLNAESGLLETLRYPGVGKPLCLATVIVSLLRYYRCWALQTHRSLCQRRLN